MNKYVKLKENIQRKALERRMVMTEPVLQWLAWVFIPELIEEYNKWLLDQGYTDSDIVHEFELKDFLQ